MVSETQNLTGNPSDLIAEQSIIGYMLIDKKWAITATSSLKETDFYTHEHQKIFSAIQCILNEKKSLDVVTVWDIIGDKTLLSSLGGPKYLMEIQSNIPPVTDIEILIKKLKKLSVLRDIIRISQFAISKAQQEDADSTKVLDETQSEFVKLAKTEISDQIVSISNVLQCSTDILQKIKRHEKFVVGFPTGFLNVDEMTSGLQPGNFMIIAGRPSMGKTAFALNMARKMSKDHNLPILFVSLEMGKTEIGFRILATETKLSLTSIKNGKLKEPQWEYLEKSITKMKDCPLYFDFSTSPDISDIRATSRKWMYEMEKQNQKLAAVFVDYLQLLSCRSMGSREQEISYISRSLKGLARELEIPIVALSQLNRKPEERGRQGIPQLADLRESGALEQDADVVCSLYRPIVYSKDEKHKGFAKLIILKQRNGPIGEIPLTFNEKCVIFEDRRTEIENEL